MSHWRVARTTNLLGRLFGETRRRAKVASTISGGRPVLKMLDAAAIRASDSWRGVRLTALERRQLERLRAKLIESAKQESVPAEKNHQPLSELKAPREVDQWETASNWHWRTTGHTV